MRVVAYGITPSSSLTKPLLHVLFFFLLFFKAPYTTPGEIATAGGMESIAANGIPEMSATPPHFALALGDNFYVSDVKNATNNKTLT